MIKSDQPAITNEFGFTLIEIICVLVILSVIFSLGARRMIQADTGAKEVMLSTGIRELNSRENVTWAVVKIDIGLVDDILLWDKIDKSLGVGFSWDTGPNRTGLSTLRFKESALSMLRTISTNSQPGKWQRN